MELIGRAGPKFKSSPPAEKVEKKKKLPITGAPPFSETLILVNPNADPGKISPLAKTGEAGSCQIKELPLEVKVKVSIESAFTRLVMVSDSTSASIHKIFRTKSSSLPIHLELSSS